MGAHFRRVIYDPILIAAEVVENTRGVVESLGRGQSGVMDGRGSEMMLRNDGKFNGNTG